MKPTGNDLFQAFQRIRQAGMGRIHKKVHPNVRPHEFFMLSTIQCHNDELKKKALDNNETVPPGIKISAISRDTGISMPGVSQTISALEKQKLVTRTTSKKDRRMVLINITEKGTKLLNDSSHEFLKFYDQALDVLGPEDGQQLIKYLDKLATAFETIEKN